MLKRSAYMTAFLSVIAVLLIGYALSPPTPADAQTPGSGLIVDVTNLKNEVKELKDTIAKMKAQLDAVIVKNDLNGYTVTAQRVAIVDKKNASKIVMDAGNPGGSEAELGLIDAGINVSNKGITLYDGEIQVRRRNNPGSLVVMRVDGSASPQIHFYTQSRTAFVGLQSNGSAIDGLYVPR
jgi:hypothetical protein